MNHSLPMWLKEIRASIKLGYPLILTNLAQIAILTTNTIYYGHLGKAELAAGSLAASLYHVTMIFSLGLVSATVPMLANALGKDGGISAWFPVFYVMGWYLE